MVYHHFDTGIYNYIPQTNHVSTVYSVAGILYLQFMVCVMLFPMLNVLYFYINTSRSVGRNGSVDRANRYGLHGPGIRYGKR